MNTKGKTIKIKIQQKEVEVKSFSCIGLKDNKIYIIDKDCKLHDFYYSRPQTAEFEYNNLINFIKNKEK